MVNNKLYRGMKKRSAKKIIGGRWKKFLFALNLQAGDLVSTCKGYNERIVEIIPCWSDLMFSESGKDRVGKGRYIYDFDLITESGGSCYIGACCTCPTETKEEIIEYWKQWIQYIKDYPDDPSSLYFKDHPIILGLIAGKEVFDQEGQLLKEFCDDYERKARFGEEHA